MIILFIPIIGNAQNDPDKEILVFFTDGIVQESIKVNNGIQKTFEITDNKLKNALSSIGIDNTLIEVALPEFSKSDTLTILDSGERLYQPDMTNLYKIKVPEDKNRWDMINALQKIPKVLYAEPNGKVVFQATPDDTYYYCQWGLKNNINLGKDIHAEAAWDIYTGNSNNIIAIVDDGVETTHYDLNDKISGGDTIYTLEGHGTAVAGVAAAESNNGQGVVGVDWQARIHPQSLSDNPDIVGAYQAIIDAVNYSSNVRVLNFSWVIVNEYGTPSPYSITLGQAIAYAYKANRTSVAAMGDHQLTDPGKVAYPAGYSNVIAVGATQINDNIYYKSPRGYHIDVCAPGQNIFTTSSNDTVRNWSGTSIAAPFVSGIASLLKGYNTNLANDDIDNILKLSADDIGAVGFDTVYGFGRVNAERALNLLCTPNSVFQWSATSGTIESSTGQYKMQFIGAQGLSPATYVVRRHEVRKTINYPNQFYHIDGVWGRGVSTNGWTLGSPNFGEGFCEVVPGTQTNTSVTLRTYVYEVWNMLGSYLGYYPASPSNVTFAYTVLGKPVLPIVGPSILCSSGGTYSISVPDGASITWSSSAGIARTSAQGSNPCTFIATNSGVTGWIGASISYNGNTYTVANESTWLGGVPSPTLYANNATLSGWNYYTVNLNASNVYFYLAPDPAGSPIYPDTWDVEGDSDWYVNGSTLNFYPNAVGENIVAGYRQNACGYNGTYFTIEVLNSKSGDDMEEVSFTLSPNPAKEYVDITLNLPEENIRGDTYQVDFVNLYLRVVKRVKISGNSNRINIQDMPTGYYMVMLRYKDGVYSNNLILE